MSLLLLAGLVTGVSLAEAASPGARGRQRRAPSSSRRAKSSRLKCVRGTPTKQDCLKPGYLDACPRDTTACKPAIEQGFDTFHKSEAHTKAPAVKMLRPESTAMPKDLKMGKLFAYRPPTRGRRLASSKSVFERTGLTGPVLSVSVSKAKKAHREPKWENNGAKAASCAEYAYEQLYDWTRFTDAAAACRGDHNCQIDVAMLPTTPGIADRVLKRKDGRPLANQYMKSGKARFAKNDMFSIGGIAEKFVLAGPPKAKKSDDKQIEKTAWLTGLIDTLEDGADHYAYGCGRGGCSPTEFENHWDFHRQLHERNRTVSLAEFEEYERRRAEFNRLLDEWGAEVDRELEELEPKRRPQAQFELPFTWVSDPWQRVEKYDILQQSVSRHFNKLKNNAGPEVVIPQAGVQGALGDDFDAGFDFDAGTQVPVAALAAPIPRRARTPARNRRASGTPKQKGTKPSPSKTTPPAGPTYASINNCEAWGDTRSKTEFLGYGPLSCRVGRFLRDEYARIDKGEYSCLDLSRDDCDWSPMMFQRTYVEGTPYLAEQKAHETEYLDWMPTQFEQSLQDIEQSIASVQADAKQAWYALEPYANKQNGKVTSIGRNFEDADHWGDKSWLATGYDSNLGWRVKAVQHGGNRPCQLSGRADAGFGVNAWILGGKINLIGSDVAAKLNDNNTGNLDVAGNLKVFGKAVYKGGKSSGTLVYAPDDGMGFGITVPKFKPSWTVMAGPVPITGSAWGEIMYGAKFNVKGNLSSQQCDVDDVAFGMDTTTMPFFAVSALGQVGVGISGVASAGVRGLVNLITFSFPIHAGLQTKKKKSHQVYQPNLGFEVGVDMLLATLSGKLMLYVEIMLIEETWELFRWKGLKSQVELMEPLKTDLPLVSWKK